MPPLEAAVVRGDRCTEAALAAGTVQLVRGRCVLATPMFGRPLAQAEVLTPLTADEAMDWAEAHFPQFFPIEGKLSGAGVPFTYRCYPQSSNCLGVSTGSPDVAVYVYGAVSGFQLLRLGSLAGYTCVMKPQNCAPPGAPTIVSATPGDAMAVIAFQAPSSSGAGNITQYGATCTAQSAATRTGYGTQSPVTVTAMINGTPYSCSVNASNVYGTGEPSASLSVTPSPSTGGGTQTGTQTGTGTVTTAGVLCNYSASVYNPSASVLATSTVAITCNSTLRTLTGNGIPDHATGQFPNANNPSAISSQNVNVAMTVAPAKNAASASVENVGYAINSVKFDPNTNATCTVSGNNVTCEADDQDHSGQWHIEAMGQAFMNLGLDSNHAHVQPGGIYHYHGMPEGLVTRQNKGTAMTLVGFAVDGFPIYAKYGYTSALYASSGTKAMQGSYQLKSTPDSGRPSIVTYPMGTFREDYQYVAGGDLDACNGRYGVTPEFPNGIYHYYITDTYPYIGRCIWGTATGGGPPHQAPR
ncbi:YHYH protein [Ramlibacter sp.]|uniref:YHYH protein n=1 Tax=Ramlibacter sp. TaxID=1917967 RepID=UPI002D7E5EEE|nr:YHYH protein [Ramlibacter sp.]